MNIFKKIAEGIRKTKDNFSKKLFYAFSAKELNDEFYDDLLDALLAADVGVDAGENVIEELKDRAFRQKIKEPEQCKNLLKQILLEEIDFEIPEYE